MWEEQNIYSNYDSKYLIFQNTRGHLAILDKKNKKVLKKIKIHSAQDDYNLETVHVNLPHLSYRSNKHDS